MADVKKPNESPRKRDIVRCDPIRMKGAFFFIFFLENPDEPVGSHPLRLRTSQKPGVACLRASVSIARSHAVAPNGNSMNSVYVVHGAPARHPAPRPETDAATALTPGLLLADPVHHVEGVQQGRGHRHTPEDAVPPLLEALDGECRSEDILSRWSLL